MQNRSLKPGLKSWGASAAILAALAAAGCEQREDSAEAAADVRPVRTVTVGDGGAARSSTFAGVIRARYESRLAFRISGQVTERLIEIGQRVTAGEPLMRIDETDASLSLLAAESQEQAARSRLAQARTDLDRSEALHARDITADAAVERDRLAVAEAEEALRSAVAQADIARNQRDYATLIADRDGVVTAIHAEAGQVVAAGQVVVEVAGDGQREVEIAVPESRVAEIREARTISVSLWSDPSHLYAGSLRELAPDTDESTRTYAARIGVADANDAVMLGLSASVSIDAAGDAELPHVPLSAVMSLLEGPQVWVVDPEAWTVSARRVTLAGTIGQEAVVGEGLVDGEIVVIAGARLLHEGQQVRPLISETTIAMGAAQ
jgi:RND family efflux transporter MFP subunit